MSAVDTGFDNPKETQAPGTDGQGTISMTNDSLILENDVDNEVEEDQLPSFYNPMGPFDTTHEFFPYSNKSRQANKELI